MQTRLPCPKYVQHNNVQKLVFVISWRTKCSCDGCFIDLCHEVLCVVMPKYIIIDVMGNDS